MVIYDGLGPKARAAIAAMPRIADLRTFLDGFRGRYVHDWMMSHEEPPPPLTHPDTDAKFAAYIDRKVKELTGHDIAWHELKPARQRRLLRR